MLVLVWLSFLLGSAWTNADSDTAREMTAASPMVKVTSGSSLFFTKHGDALCQSAPHGLSRDYYVDRFGIKQKSQINSCLQGTDENFKMTCKLGMNGFTLTKFAYAKLDSTCSNPLVAAGAVYLRSTLCFKRYGVYLKMRCGEDALLTSLLTKAQVVSPVLYPTKYCFSPTQSIGGSVKKFFTWFDVCTPYVSSSVSSIEYNFVVSLTSSSPLNVRLKKYANSDTNCTSFVRGIKDIAYPQISSSASLTGPCLPDELHPGFYYSNVQSLAPYAVAAAIPIVTSASDGQSLCDFYDTMQYKSALSTWSSCEGSDAPSSPCAAGSSPSWLGVTCELVDGVYRVTKLLMWQTAMPGMPYMAGVGLGVAAQIPDSLGNLVELRELALNQNSLTGSIPSSLGQLTKLQKLDLSLNFMVGTLPASLGGLTALTSLNLNSAGLSSPGISGSVPSSFCGLSTSTSLDIQGNSGLTCRPACLSAAYSQFFYSSTLSVCA